VNTVCVLMWIGMVIRIFLGDKRKIKIKRRSGGTGAPAEVSCWSGTPVHGE